MFTERDWQRFLLGDTQTLEERLRKWGHHGKHGDALVLICNGYSCQEADAMLDLRPGKSLAVARRAKAEVREALCQRAVLSLLTPQAQGIRALADELQQTQRATRNRLQALAERGLASHSYSAWRLGVAPQVLGAFATRTELLTCNEIEQRSVLTISSVRRGVRTLVDEGWLLWSGMRSGVSGAPNQYRRTR